MNTQCKPLDKLATGTPVRVGMKSGKVIKCEKHNAHPSGFIMVHTVQLTEQRIKKAGKYKTIPINETWRGNYSALYY